jgi:hypothetical protein
MSENEIEKPHEDEAEGSLDDEHEARDDPDPKEPWAKISAGDDS